MFFQAFVALPLDMRAHGISTAAFGTLMTINPVLIVLLQPWAGEVIRDRSPLPVMSLASLLIGVGFGLNAWAGSAPAYIAAIVLFTFGEILFAPASVSFVADLSPAPLRGRYQGVFAIAFTTAFAAAPALGGYLHDRRRRPLAVDCLPDHRVRRVGGLSAAARPAPGCPTVGTHMRLS